jgi:hypothetical protein
VNVVFCDSKALLQTGEEKRKEPREGGSQVMESVLLLAYSSPSTVFTTPIKTPG